MTIRFFPRDGQFWLYHLGSSLFTAAITLLTVAWWSPGPLVALDSAAAIVWLLPYTLAVLAFRWQYKARNWKAWSMGRLIVAVFGFGMAAALLVTGAVAALTLPLFWGRLAEFYAAGGSQLIPHQYLSRTILSGSLQAQVILCAWMFIYISFTGRRDMREQELALKDAQLRNLANQLNPHFLFNSLNNIRFMIHENAQQADSMLVGLSEVLRYSLEGGTREKVSLAQEAEIIQRYLAIMAVQFEERLRCRIDIPAHLQSCLVPPLMLQILVENAVKHGIEHLQQGGVLEVSARAQGPHLQLVVANDMAGAQDHRAGLGIGLPNIERRLQLLYGERASHAISRSGGRFVVTLNLPKELST